MLTSISPIDGRYYKQVSELSSYFSEYALIKYRVRVEIEYFIALCEAPLYELDEIPTDYFEEFRDIYRNFTTEDAQKVKSIESITNHDVKAVEYFIKERFVEMGISPQLKEFVHFGLTSQDINNTAIPLSLMEGIQDTYLPPLYDIINKLGEFAQEWSHTPMLARTHGQPASPTMLGKEMEVFQVRLQEQLKVLLSIPYAAKFGGATGNMNAHFVAYPTHDWHAFAAYFVEEILGLKRSFPTTQIEHYDYMAALFDGIKRINNILIDLARDIWMYISMDYFKQRIKEGEVGSSAMPHKVNPIDFENGEGNFGYANAICEFLASKLPISRLQRDLTDSTVLRNIGVPIAHSIIGFKSILKGLNKLILNDDKLYEDLDNNWAVVAEALQTILRREGYPNPYETLKDLTRTGTKISKETISEFIERLDMPEYIKEEMRNITPYNYTGV